jgi:hypothetical protein
MGLGSGIRIKPTPDPGSRGQKGTGSRRAHTFRSDVKMCGGVGENPPAPSPLLRPRDTRVKVSRGGFGQSSAFWTGLLRVPTK